MRHQQGTSLIGFFLVSIVLCSALLLIFKVTPAYMEHLNIASTLDSVQKNITLPSNTAEARQEIRRAIQRRFDVQDVDTISARDVEITQIRNGFELTAKYTITVKVIGNLAFQLSFEDEGQVTYSGR